MRKYHCERCLHDWYPRKPGKPRQCPRCKSVLWDVPKLTGNENLNRHLKQAKELL
jgi:predicted Zn-ribbon and HTH transcriptional regulator